MLASGGFLSGDALLDGEAVIFAALVVAALSCWASQAWYRRRHRKCARDDEFRHSLRSLQ
jgi:hypothetical protein